MSAGTWTTQNKVRPGAYVNFKSEARPLGAVGDRGTVTMALPLSWGAAKSVTAIEAGDDTRSTLGYDLTSPELLVVREALKRAKTVLLYRLNTGTPATATVGELTATAKFGGLRGNDVSIVINESLDEEDRFDVQTLVAGEVVDVQTVGQIEQLAANDWVVFSGTGELEETAGVPLSGGANGTVTNQDYVDYLAAIEVHEFETVALTSTDNALKETFVSFCKRLREDEGKKIQIVVENYPLADYEGVISVRNGVVLADGTELTAAQATAWVAGASAGAQVNESLTHTAYDGAVDVLPKHTNTQIIQALQQGEFIFTHRNGRAIVEQDINSLHSFTPAKNKEFSKNRVVRVLDGINQDFVRIFSDFYIGKVDNNEDGRSLLQNECVNYLNILQNMNAIQNFASQTDISVVQGADIDSVYIETYVQPVDAIEKIYVQVTVR
ncbi:phage tail sheath family protein [Bacillus horti]|uniref:Phage tail sheath protein n=1 Tax=Caldalkalibacillus horti TaxID=77523 RepID=A0ABT9W1A7_9BACI|nr:phage tail sheath family protein [Bacillus horti]MDQ0166635.1 hypothetical protein [Bacillus horti]